MENLQYKSDLNNLSLELELLKRKLVKLYRKKGSTSLKEVELSLYIYNFVKNEDIRNNLISNINIGYEYLKSPNINLKMIIDYNKKYQIWTYLDNIKYCFIDEHEKEAGNFNSLIIKNSEISIKIKNINTTAKENNEFLLYIANSLSFNIDEKVSILVAYKRLPKKSVLEAINILKIESLKYKELSYNEYGYLVKKSEENKGEWFKLEKDYGYLFK